MFGSMQNTPVISIHIFTKHGTSETHYLRLFLLIILLILNEGMTSLLFVESLQ